MSKVTDAATADGSSGFFKIFQDTWAKKSSGSSGSDDYWGTKDLNSNCGKMDFKIPSDLTAGDYLLRAEAIALHAASGLNGAQFYMTCYQITVTGGGSSSPSGVLFPGAYKATDPGIEINIYQNLATYIAPGPAVIAGGSEAVAGKVGLVVTATAGSPSQPTASVTKALFPTHWRLRLRLHCRSLHQQLEVVAPEVAQSRNISNVAVVGSLGVRPVR
jgi:cellulase